MEPIESSADRPPTAGETAHYAGVIVIVPPDRVEKCARDLAALSGVDVYHRHAESGRIVVVLEGRTVEKHLETLRRIQTVPDVLVAAPVYHYVDAGSSVEGGKNQDE